MQMNWIGLEQVATSLQVFTTLSKGIFNFHELPLGLLAECSPFPGSTFPAVFFCINARAWKNHRESHHSRSGELQFHQAPLKMHYLD